MKRVGIIMDDELHKQLKYLAVNEGRTVTDIIVALVKTEIETKKDLRDCSKTETCKPRNHFVL